MSDLDLEQARLRRAWTSLSDAASPGPDCPAADRLWEACRGEQPPEETRALVDHTTSCPSCAEAWRLARELTAVAPAPSSRAPVTIGAPRLGWWGGLGGLSAAAAAVVLAAVVLLRAPADVVYRDAQDPVLRPLLREARSLPRDGFVLRWVLEVPGPDRGSAGTRYDVQVATEELVVVARARGLETASYQVPEPALRSLPPGTRLLWRVEATLPDGRRVSSATFVATLR